jgi:hypothetical protein
MDFSAEMPWLALPQNAFEAKKKLVPAKYKPEEWPGRVNSKVGVEILVGDTIKADLLSDEILKKLEALLTKALA